MLSPIKVDNNAGSLLEIAGEMTIYTAAALLKDIDAALAKGGDVELRLGGVTEMDTAGLQLLLLARRRAGARVCVSGRSEAVERALETCRLAPLLDNMPTGGC